MQPERANLLPNPRILILDAPPGAAPAPEDFRACAFDPLIESADAVDDLDAVLARCDCLLLWRRRLTPAMIEQATRCLMIVCLGPATRTGIDPATLDAARRRGIYITSIPDYASGPWADSAWDKLQQWTARLDWPSLTHRRFGLVGLGQAGRAVAARALEAKMRLWACDPFTEEVHFDRLNCRPTQLDELLGLSEIVSIQIPFTSSLRAHFDARRLRLLKPGALLLIACDLRLFDLDALHHALQSNRLAGLGFVGNLGSHLPSGHPLVGHPRILADAVDPDHTPPAFQNLRRRTVDLIDLTLSGRRPPHLLIDPPCPRQILLQADEAWER